MVQAAHNYEPYTLFTSSISPKIRSQSSLLFKTRTAGNLFILFSNSEIDEVADSLLTSSERRVLRKTIKAVTIDSQQSFL